MWNLWIKDTLGSAILSSVERLSSKWTTDMEKGSRISSRFSLCWRILYWRIYCIQHGMNDWQTLHARMSVYQPLMTILGSVYWKLDKLLHACNEHFRVFIVYNTEVLLLTITIIVDLVPSCMYTHTHTHTHTHTQDVHKYSLNLWSKGHGGSAILINCPHELLCERGPEVCPSLGGCPLTEVLMSIHDVLNRLDQHYKNLDSKKLPFYSEKLMFSCPAVLG